MTQPHLQSFEHIGPAIRRLREARGLRQSDLADKVKMNRASLSRLENDHAQPKPETVKKLLEALDVGETEMAEAIEKIRSERAAMAAALDSFRRSQWARAKPAESPDATPASDTRKSNSTRLREYLLVADFLQAVAKGKGEAWLEEMQSFLDDVRRVAPPLAQLADVMRRLDPAKEISPVDLHPDFLAALEKAIK